MGPADISDMSSSSNPQALNLPKLRSNSSNWSTYSERIINYLTSKGLKRHVLGTARMPVILEERDGNLFKPRGTTPLTNEEIEKHEEEEETYEQKQAAVREVIYRTVDKSTFLQVKNEISAANVWRKLISVHADKGMLYETNLLTQLQTLRLVEKGNMREHLTQMTEIKERLAEMNCPLSDESFVSYLRTSLSLVPNYRSLLTTLNATAHESGRKLTSENLIWHLTEEANSIAIEESINKSNAALIVAMAKTKDGKNKSKTMGRPKLQCLNQNCKKTGHTIDKCYAKGGGKEKEAPEWFKKLQKKEGSASINVAEKSEMDNNEKYAMLTCNSDNDSTTLIVTSEFPAEAHATSENDEIILDSGASRHFSPNRSKFINYQEINPEPIRAADGRTFSALGKGDLEIKLPNGDQKPTQITLMNVYYSPNMAYTLMSVSCVDQAGYSVTIKGGTCIIRSPKSKIIGQIPLSQGLYRISKSDLKTYHSANSVSQTLSITELHRKMGHINHEDLRRLIKDGMVTGLNVDLNSKPEFCEACIKAKSDRKPFPKKSNTTYSKYGEKVVADLWGPARVDSLGGNKYYSLFKDLASREERVYFLKTKSEALTTYKKYEAWVSLQRDSRIKVFGCDRGGEFMSKDFSTHLEHMGTIRHLTIHDSPASNGAVEHGNRTHLNNARAMMIAAGLPRFLWAEAVRHDVWLRNRAPTRALTVNQTPYEVATGIKPDLTKLYEWGIPIWVKLLDAGKLDIRAEEVRFIGFDDESKGIRVYWPKQRKVSIERDVYVDKNRALLPDEVSIEGVEDVFDNQDTSHKTSSHTNDSPNTRDPNDLTKSNEDKTNEKDTIPSPNNIRPEEPKNTHKRQENVPQQRTV